MRRLSVLGERACANVPADLEEHKHGHEYGDGDSDGDDDEPNVRGLFDAGSLHARWLDAKLFDAQWRG
jgi:hypothetical protein